MSHSNSSLNTFASCMAKYEHAYILKTPPCKPISPHLTFGSMAHDVLYKAGIQRDELRDGVRAKTEYNTVIPSEVLYPELKDFFKIQNWHNYFMPVIKQIAEYEEQLLSQMSKACEIHRELKLQLMPQQLLKYKCQNITEPLVGIIDLLFINDNEATIIDYKFSSSKKTQDDFDMNSQLPIYALLVHENFGIPLRNIKVGYIDIPKQCLEAPIILSNGILSRSKSQNVSQEIYKACVDEVHEHDPYYNCEPGGYYYDCWCALANNKAAYLSVQYLDA